MSEWIKCSDRLPEFVHHPVIVSLKYNNRTLIRIACLDRDGTFYEAATYESFTDKISHWMPLPPPPEDKS